MVWMGRRAAVTVHAETRTTLKRDFACVAEIDACWQEDEEWHSRQGHQTADFSNRPTVAKYIDPFTFIPRERMPTIKGIAWLTFPAKKRAYTPRDAVNIARPSRKQTAKYADLHKEQKLSELYSSPIRPRRTSSILRYIGPNFVWDEISAIAGAEIARTPSISGCV